MLAGERVSHVGVYYCVFSQSPNAAHHGKSKVCRLILSSAFVMSATDPWVDFEVCFPLSLCIPRTILIITSQTLKVNVRLNTVDRLKQIIVGFNDECWTMLSKSGKKQDLINRILHSLDEWRTSSNIEKWNKARSVLYQVRNSGM
jgi:hypothetical protein